MRHQRRQRQRQREEKRWVFPLKISSKLYEYAYGKELERTNDEEGIRNFQPCTLHLENSYCLKEHEHGGREGVPG